MAPTQQDSQEKWSFHLCYNEVADDATSLLRMEDKPGGTTGAEIRLSSLEQNKRGEGFFIVVL